MQPPLQIGITPDPRRHPHWPQFKAFLEPAAAMGGMPTLLGPHELLWTVYDGARPIAAATARLTVEDNACEIILCGGVGHRDWAVPLTDMIARWATMEGRTTLRVIGRRGWARVLGWDVIEERDGMTMIERTL